MKKLLIIFALLVGCFSYGQNVIGNAFSIKSLTSTQRDALNVTNRYPIIYNSTTGQFERYNGSAWVKDLTVIDLDTFSELDAIVADKSLANLDDNNTWEGVNTFNGSIKGGTGTHSVDTGSLFLFGLNLTEEGWLINQTTGTNTLTLRNSTSGTPSTFTTRYTFPATGTASATTDVLTKAHGDDNYLSDGDTPTSLVLTNATGLPFSGLANGSANTFVGFNGSSAPSQITAAGIVALTNSVATTLTNKTISGASNTITNIGATELASTTVTPGSYTNTDLTVDADGRITAASNGSGGSGESTTVSDSAELDFTLSTYDITASLIAGSIDETKLDASVNASLDLADSALQNTSVDTFAELDALVVDETLINEADIIDNAFNSDWNADINHTASRNAIYDYVNTLASKTGTETITNKTIDADNNTISNIGASEITDDSILAADLNTTNSPTDNYLYTFDAASGGGTWVSQTGTDDQTAAEVSYDNTSSGLIADDLQDAIDEVAVDELTQAAFDALTTSQKIALGPYIILPDAPSGYSVTIDDDPMSDDGTDSFTWASAEVGAYYDWSLSSSGGGTPVTGFGTIATATDVISIGSITGLSDGTATLTAYLTNAGGQGADATDTAVLGTVLTSPPLSGNANPELITGNALAFGTDEVNGTANITSSSNAVITSELVDDGYEGDYVLRIDADGETGGYARARRLTLSISSSTTYDFALLYKHAGTQSGDFQVSGSVSGQIYNSASLGATTWTLLTGSFTTGASDTSINIDIWCQQPFGSADGTEVMEAKLSIKAQ